MRNAGTMRAQKTRAPRTQTIPRDPSSLFIFLGGAHSTLQAHPFSPLSAEAVPKPMGLFRTAAKPGIVESEEKCFKAYCVAKGIHETLEDTFALHSVLDSAMQHTLTILRSTPPLRLSCYIKPLHWTCCPETFWSAFF